MNVYNTSGVRSSFLGGGVAYLIDPDSYADLSLYISNRDSHVRQAEE